MTLLISRLNRPDGVGGVALGVAGAIWAGTLLPPLAMVGVLAVAGIVAARLVSSRRKQVVVVAGLMMALLGGLGSAKSARAENGSVVLPTGRIVMSGIAATDVIDDGFVVRPEHLMVAGVWHSWEGPALHIGEVTVAVAAGERVEVSGLLKANPGRLRGVQFAGRIRGASVTVSGASGPVVAAANGLRGRVSSGLRAWGDAPEAALVAGFLIGDTTRLPTVDYDALRRAGLTHFVAVSGSNVALFLGLWWMVLGPLGVGTRRRAVLGLIGLAVFVVMTRWEPSVLRASVMAGVILVSKVAGVPLSGWSSLGVTVSALLLWSAELSVNVGFQLSVAATIGVMMATNLFPNMYPKALGSAIGITLGAQVAVGPLLLVHFGSLPILSPIINIVASPLVALSTIAGGIGVLTGFEALVRMAIGVASVVLELAHIGARWPAAGWFAYFGSVAAAILTSYRSLRPFVLAGLAIVLAVVVRPTTVREPTVVFLDVGQGDAVLLFDGDGTVILVDGGPTAPELNAGLRRYGVERIDLVVVSHPHADHIAGMIGVVERYPVGALWHPGYVESGAQFESLARELDANDVVATVPVAGDRFQVGQFVIEVIGPIRRYDSPNDQSVVLLVEFGSVSVLLPGDIERLAQADLTPVRTEILKVPHHGSDTNAPEWLVATGADTAVIQVGAGNSFGHPSAELVSAMEAAGMTVLRTDIHGDVVIPLRFRGNQP